jgi:hypothetical protein
MGLASSACTGATKSPNERQANSDTIFRAFFIPGLFCFRYLAKILAGFERPVNSDVPVRRAGRGISIDGARHTQRCAEAGYTFTRPPIYHFRSFESRAAL